MIASLPMYDWPEVQAHTDSYWQAIRAALGSGPTDLRRDIDDMHAHWLDPDLLLSQTCGMPYRTRLLGKVTRIGTPDYALPDCPAGHYCSVIVAHGQDDRDQLADFTQDIFAYNEGGSQSGWAAPMSHAAARGLRFDRLLPTGAHRASIRAVAKGQAALASIDAMTWQLALRHEPAALRLKVLARTDPTPGLPYITRLGRDPAPIARAIAMAIADMSADTRAALHLSGLCDIPDQAYLAVPTPPAPAA